MKKAQFLVVFLLICIPTMLLAQSPAPPDDIAARMARLEAETQALRAEVQRLREDPARLPPVDATPPATAPAPDAAAVPAAAPATDQGDYFTLDELRGEMKKFSWKKGDFSITPYVCIWRIVEIYLTRWKCDESFRYIKQCYNLEDIRVRSYIAIRNTIVLILAVAYFAAVYLGDNLKLK